MDGCYQGLSAPNGKTTVLCPSTAYLKGVPDGGFDWGGDKGIRPLARELLVHRICVDGLQAYTRAVSFVPQFMAAVVANFPREGWTLTTGEFDEWIRNNEAEAATTKEV